ncbi:ABC transporter permease [Gordonia spumicola]|uniref:ABC transporter permease n=1 Tax=Gordonia spumicola TaxID=589161 RepID=A0A7I9V9E1_9ACTN|nr:ABC transporter permease [Gordonia spumicola]GEE01929.1 ABC transporter permease [Gordonia spumicola]
MSVHEGVATLAAVITLAGVTVGVLRWYGVPQQWAAASAVARGLVQLVIVSVALTGLITHPALVFVAVAIMFAIAVATAAGRLASPGTWWRTAGFVAIAVASGVLVALGTVFATGALEPTSRYLLAVSAIVIGNTMNITTLTGRRLTEALIERWDEVEAWLALGATPRQAATPMARQAVHSALVPSIDQTKTTGLVTLPGAFVGAIFGGLSPVEAGRFQVLVLAALLASGSIAAVITARVRASSPTRPEPLDRAARPRLRMRTPRR